MSGTHSAHSPGRFRIDVCGVPIFTDDAEYAIRLARQVAGEPGPKPPTPPSAPAEAPSAQHPPVEQNESGGALAVGPLLFKSYAAAVLRPLQGQSKALAKEAICEATGLSASLVARGFQMVREQAEEQEVEPAEIYIRETRGREAYFRAGPLLYGKS